MISLPFQTFLKFVWLCSTYPAMHKFCTCFLQICEDTLKIEDWPKFQSCFLISQPANIPQKWSGTQTDLWMSVGVCIIWRNFQLGRDIFHCPVGSKTCIKAWIDIFISFRNSKCPLLSLKYLIFDNLYFDEKLKLPIEKKSHLNWCSRYV